jgi:hypothetical protein
MTRASVIVATWLLLIGNIGDAARTAGASHAALLALYYGVTILVALALWVQFQPSPGDAEAHPPASEWD